jgi:hypothetical protein
MLMVFSVIASSTSYRYTYCRQKYTPPKPTMSNNTGTVAIGIVYRFIVIDFLASLTPINEPDRVGCFMLPFHLKSPNYGGKLKKQLAGSPDHPLRDGGPFQRAIAADLLELQKPFLDRIASLSSSSSKDDHTHYPVGSGFAAFKEIFSSAKVALLHTRFVPIRVDAGAYAQLLYAVCFQLLRAEANSSNLLNRGAYAVFLLHALFETNPLPTEPRNDNTREQMESLPMAVQNRENRRLLYRRSYREPIRIDQEHYCYIMQLRDLALAACARCEQARSRQQTEDSDDPWTCQCLVSQDMSTVISRLLPNLQFSAYTGPCGLEGLAGHADYSVPPTAKTQAWWKQNRSKAHETSAIGSGTEESSSPPPVQEVFSEQLQSQLEDYLSDKKAIRLPAVSNKMTHHSKRVREALLPIFSPDPALAILLEKCKGEEPSSSQPKRLKVHFSDVVVNAAGGGSGTLAEGATVESSREEAFDDEGVALDLVLPNNLTPELEESLQAAFDTLVKRGDFLHQPPVPTTFAENDVGDVSTLGGSRGVSTAASTGRSAPRTRPFRANDDESVVSTTTGAGRNALRDLLSAANDESASVASTTTGAGRNALRALLSAANEESTSVASATTGVGRNALRDLLSAANEESTSVASTTTGAGRNALGALLSAANEESNNQHDTGKPINRLKIQDLRRGEMFLGSDMLDDNEEKAVDHLSDISSDEDNNVPGSVTASTVGHAALRDLLSFATGRQRSPKNTKPRKTKKAATKKARKTKRATTKKARSKESSEDDDNELSSLGSKDDGEISSSSSEANSAQGRSALDVLLAHAIK